jgi:hypothetical protein
MDTKEEIKKYLEENLSIFAELNDNTIDIFLRLEGEVISNTKVFLPFEDLDYDDYGNRI